MPTSTRHLLNAVSSKDIVQIQANVSQYFEFGIVQYGKVLAINSHARIPNLTHVYGFDKIQDIVAVLLAGFCNALNVVRPMSPDQIFDCSIALVMTTQEDQLSIEDLAVFFQGAKEGKYGKILDRMDQQTLFSLLEVYREERHQEFRRIKDEQHQNLKAAGPSERMTQRNELADSFNNIAGRMADMKDKLKEQRDLNRIQEFKRRENE